jgi:hypothetical protein
VLLVPVIFTVAARLEAGRAVALHDGPGTTVAHPVRTVSPYLLVGMPAPGRAVRPARPGAAAPGTARRDRLARRRPRPDTAHRAHPRDPDGDHRRTAVRHVHRAPGRRPATAGLARTGGRPGPQRGGPRRGGPRRGGPRRGS